MFDLRQALLAGLAQCDKPLVAVADEVPFVDGNHEPPPFPGDQLCDLEILFLERVLGVEK